MVAALLAGALELFAAHAVEAYSRCAAVSGCPTMPLTLQHGQHGRTPLLLLAQPSEEEGRASLAHTLRRGLLRSAVRGAIGPVAECTMVETARTALPLPHMSMAIGLGKRGARGEDETGLCGEPVARSFLGLPLNGCMPVSFLGLRFRLCA